MRRCATSTLSFGRRVKQWLEKCGFIDVRIVDACVTSTEEQRTEWMTTESLADFLDPQDSSKTREGYPARCARCLLPPNRKQNSRWRRKSGPTTGLTRFQDKKGPCLMGRGLVRAIIILGDMMCSKKRFNSLRDNNVLHFRYRFAIDGVA
jgi:hypothetical protein